MMAFSFIFLLFYFKNILSQNQMASNMPRICPNIQKYFRILEVSKAGLQNLRHSCQSIICYLSFSEIKPHIQYYCSLIQIYLEGCIPKAIRETQKMINTHQNCSLLRSSFHQMAPQFFKFYDSIDFKVVQQQEISALSSDSSLSVFPFFYLCLSLYIL